ncbi:hypothetical protein [Plantactinospora sp. KLBMP9567]|uniref:ABC transporter permease n=1 Tax=Plantactinospora sp. KLBMP9567 TaxID=3085900 RepID=UPI0029826A7B|nr:hypothetical protein [Plantactinospora sp. KLBMP9567]MDW5323059.1 hypothetical protein [Plantactinospora sp. KLBMP9567]
MRRPLRVELRRGTAPGAALLMFGAGGWLLAVHPEDWGGRWAGLAGYLRTSLMVLCGLMVAAGAWQAGRERRRGMAELLGSTARPGWQPLVVAWLAVSLAGTAGLLTAFLGAAVLVGRVATYTGGGWWWTLAVGILALCTAAAFGVLIGRLVPLRVVAPVAGLGTYLGLAVLAYWDASGVSWLSPVHPGSGPERLLPAGTHALQAGWLLALTGTLLALAARLRRVALLAGTLAVAVAVPIATGAGPGRLRTDPGAVEPTCTTEGPPVCVARINDFLLDDLTPLVQPVLRRMAGIPGAPTRAADAVLQVDGEPTGPVDGTLWLYLGSQPTATGDGLANLDWLRADLRQVVTPNCHHRTARPDRRIYPTFDAARAWLFEERPAPDTRVGRLYALSLHDQRAWFGAFLDAAHRCDVPRLIALGELP